MSAATWRAGLRRAWILGWAGLALLGGGPEAPAEPVRDEVRDLFQPAPGAAGRLPAGFGGPLRPAIAVRLRPGFRGAEGRPGDRWRMPLPDGSEIVVRQGRSWLGEAGVTLLTGTLEGEPGSEVRLAGRGAALAGTVRNREGRVFRIEPRGEGIHAVAEVPEGLAPECGNEPGAGGALLDPAPVRALAAAVPSGIGTPAAETVLDVAFLYTRAAEEGAGGADGMETLLALAVAEANDTYEHSAVRLRLRSVCRVRTDYVESGDLSTDLGRLAAENDGWLVEAQTLRDRHAADLVCLVVEWEGSNRYAGMGNQLRDTNAGSLAQGYTACLRPYLVGNYTLPHEVGHLLGCDHDRENSVGGGLQSWSFGTRPVVDGVQYRTVMAYRPGRQFPYFSNPAVLFRGVPTGIAAGRDAADNARTLNFTGPLVAGVREPASRIGFEQTELRVSEGEGTVSLRLARGGTLGASQVVVSTVAASAVDGVDYVGFRTTVALPAGSPSVEVPLMLRDNSARDGSRRLAVQLEAPGAGLSLGPIPVVNVVIADDEEESAAPLDSRFRPQPGADYLVGALVADPEGRLLAGGAFATMNGEVHPRLARLLPDGSVDASFGPEVKYRIHAMARFPDGRLALGGDFNTVNQERLNHVAILQPGGGVDPRFTFDPGTDLTVYAVVALPDGRLLVGGAFTNVQNQVALRVVRLLATGQVDATFASRAGPDDTVWALARDSEGRVLAGGRFGRVAGRNRPGLARFDAAGALDTRFLDGATANGAVRAVAVDGAGRVLAAGEFTRFQDRSAGRLVRVSRDGVRDEAFQLAFGVGADEAVLAVVPDSVGRIWIGGRFRSVGGWVRRGVARLLESGAVDSSFDPGSGPDDAVLALALRDGGVGGIWIGGLFREVNGRPRAGIAAYLPGSPAAPHFDGWAAEGDGLAWSASVAPGQSYRLERSSDLRFWWDAGTAWSADGRVTGRAESGSERIGYLRLGRLLE